MKKFQGIFIPVLAVFLGLFAGYLVMLVFGYDPVVGFGAMYEGVFSEVSYLGDALKTATPLIFTGLGFAVAYTAGFFNVGLAGQALAGWVASVFVGSLMSNVVPIIAVPVSLLAGIIAGALWAAIAGILKAYFNASEVIVTIMLNYVMVYLSDYLLRDVFTDRGSTLYASETATLKAEWLTNLTDGSQLHTGILYAVVTIFVVHVLMNRTTTGFELKSVGMNPFASRYAGMNSKRNIILAMVISGALAGLGGVMNGLGEFGYLFKMDGVSPAIGFDGMAVSLLGLNNPIGILVSAILFGGLKTGGNFMQLYGIPPEIVNIVIALIIFFIGASYLITYFFDLNAKRQAAKLSSKLNEGGKANG